jgi:hypothetical protein
MKSKNEFVVINQVVAVGSVDGILTSAALLHLIGSPDVDIVFTQAFAVDKIDVSTWKPGRKVAFVDLAVNNRDKSMTANFVRRIREAGHEIVAVCDEHSREDWLEVLGTLDGLLIEPRSQAGGVYTSSGTVLRGACWDVNEHAAELCLTAELADKMQFAGIGELVNKAVKSKIQDDTRRVYLARHFATNHEADSTIQEWIKEYEAILQSHLEILAAKQDLGNGIVRVSAVGKTVDMTTLLSQLYGAGFKVVICEGEMFNKALGKKTRQIAFGTNEKLDLLACVKAVVPSASGFAQKVNVEPEHEAAALSAVRALLRG